jgi:hypothetical protein
MRPTSNIDLLHGMIEGYFLTYASSPYHHTGYRRNSDYLCPRSPVEGIHVICHVSSSEVGHANNPVDGSAHWATLRDVRIGKVSYPRDHVSVPIQRAFPASEGMHSMQSMSPYHAIA